MDVAQSALVDTRNEYSMSEPSQKTPERLELEKLLRDYALLAEQKQALEMRVFKGEERRRALMHILSDLNMLNRKLADQRKAMIHILADYERDRSH